MADSTHQRGVPGSEEPADDHSAATRNQPGGYPPGWRVAFRCRTKGSRRSPPAAQAWFEVAGTITGCGLRDLHTGTTWIPVRVNGATADSLGRVVRVTDILYVSPPTEED